MRALGFLLAATAAATGQGPGIALVNDAERGVLAVRIGDRVVCAYRYGEEYALPHVFPLRSPSGKPLTVQHPDPYPHHRSLWIADAVRLGDGPATDFYHCWKNRVDREDRSAGHHSAIRHRGFRTMKVVGGEAMFCAELEWVAQGTPVLAETRTFRVRALGNGEYTLDLRWALRAAFGEVTFTSDAVHYAWPYLRAHPRFAVDGGGTMVDNRGRSGQEETHGARARWVDVSNTVDGVTEGVAVFVPGDGEPPRWLTRDYGCFGPRRKKARNGTGFTLEEGGSLQGRVRVLVHRGDAEQGDVAEHYRRFVEEAR